MKKIKTLTLLACCSSFIFLTTPVFAQSNLDSINSSKEILIIDHASNNLISKFQSRKFDNHSNELASKFRVKSFDTVSEVTFGNPLAVNFNDLSSNPKLLSDIKQCISDGCKVYFYGDAIKVSNLNSLLGFDISKHIRGKSKNQPDNSTWQIISYQNSMNYQPIFGRVQLDEKNGQKGNLSNFRELYIQSILNDEDTSSPNVKTNVTPFDYSSDPIVSSQYNITSDAYAYDSNNNYVQTAHLNDYWLLHKDNSSTDPSYQYFFIEDSIQEFVYNGAGAVGLDIQHSPNGNTLQWSPSSSSSGGSSTWTVGLPWAVTWSFSSNDTLAADVTGTQGSSGYGHWSLSAPWYYPSGYLASGDQYRPGTAFSFPKSGYGPYYLSFPLYHTFHYYWPQYNQYIQLSDNATVTYSF